MASKKPLPRTGQYRSQPKQEVDLHEYQCCCCGKVYPEQKGNFYKTMSVLYRGNNAYYPICKQCMEALYAQYYASFGDEYRALKTIARQWDIYINDDIYSKVVKSPPDKGRVSELIRNASLSPHKGKNYDDVVQDDLDAQRAGMIEMHDSGIDVSDEVKARWGFGYDDSEYELLEKHYQSFAEQLTEGDIVQEKLVIDLSRTNLAGQKCLNNRDYDGWQKMSKLYQDTLKNANFKPIQKGGNLNDDNQCYSAWLRDVEAFSPADLYQDKGLFNDVDGIDNYWQRHIVRPFRNFFLGLNEQDTEYCIRAGDSDDTDKND